MAKGILRAVIVVLVGLLTWSCAQRSPLSGGPKDVWPPKLLRSNPDTFATNFSGDKIRLEFDEFVKVNNARRNLLVTPVLRYDPIVVESGKKVIIKDLDDSLWANTTYVMEFNEAIQDITEKNPAKGFRFVFSTGPYVDSLEVHGTLKDAYTLKPIEDAFVFLYEKNEDSIPYKEKPRYVGRSDDQGNFAIRNMKAGEYKVFMTTDENRNYFYDPASEKLDFVDSLIRISSDTGQFILGHLFNQESPKQFVKGYGMLNRYAMYISFRKPVDSLNLSSFGEQDIAEELFSRSYNASRDSVVLWLTDSLDARDKWDLLINADDQLTDSLKMEYYGNEKKAKRFVLKQNIQGNKLDLDQDLEFYFDYPLVKLDTSLLTLLEDSMPVEFKLSLNATKRTMRISKKWKFQSNYNFIIDTAALTDINGHVIDSLSRPFTFQEKKYYGTLELSLSGTGDKNGILIIMDQGGKELDRVLMGHDKEHFFEYMRPGEYYLKYVVDENSNGRWDPGYYPDRRHAETVFIYQQGITIRSNWDQVIEWKFK